MNWSVIGLFGRVINNNVELCSDWLFQSAAQCWALLWLAVSQCGSFQLISHTAGRKHREENIYFNTFSRQVIILYIKCGHQGAAINMRGTETAFKCTIAFLLSLSLSRFTIAWTLFILWSGSTYHTFYKIRCLSVVFRICKSFAIILSHLSLLCLCGKWNFMYCNVTGYR